MHGGWLTVSWTMNAKILLRLGVAAAMVVSSVSAKATIWYVSPNGNDGNPGFNWATAKRSVTAALGGAVLGDEIHVAAGIYRERIKMKPGVGLYGGWSGLADVRDTLLFPTILDGNAAGCVVECLDPKADAAARLDGFVVQNGSGIMGGGIAIALGAPVISNNLIAANSGMHGGGILLYDTGPGVQVINNTLADNSPSGLRWMNCSPLIANNLVTGNGVGISRNTVAPGEAPVFRYNAVCGNVIDFDGFTNPGFAGGNLPLIPRLARPDFGNYRLQPNSPLIDAGDPTFLVAGETDAFGTSRKIGGGVDIGAGECDGTAWNVPTPVIRVPRGVSPPCASRVESRALFRRL